MGILLALAIAWVYAETMVRLGREWLSSPDASYGVVLVAVAAIVAWQRRDACVEALRRQSHHRTGAVVLVGGLLLYLVGQLGADVFLARLSLILVLTGALWFVAGAAVIRVMAAPLVFLLMAVPLPTILVNAVTLPLQFTASRIAEGTLAAAGVPVFRDGNVLELPSASLQVAEACSGLRSLVSLTAIAVLLAWSTIQVNHETAGRGTTWLRAAAIVAAAVPVAIVLNGLRIAGVGLSSEAWGPRMTSGAWHTFSGWVTFVVAALVLIAIQRLIAPTRSRSTAIERAVAA